jgi:hypothetical protein
MLAAVGSLLLLFYLRPAPAQTPAPAKPEMTENCPGLVAADEPQVIPAALRLAALNPDQVRISYSGHSTFLIESPRAQSAGGKSDAALPKEAAKEPAKETTGSITVPSAATAPLAPVPAPLTGIVPGWAVRDVYRGVAMLQSRLGGMVEVEPGDVLPGLGRIEAIRRQDGRWVVVTSKGTITSMR